jgi:hypothetical protein
MVDRRVSGAIKGEEIDHKIFLFKFDIFSLSVKSEGRKAG